VALGIAPAARPVVREIADLDAVAQRRNVRNVTEDLPIWRRTRLRSNPEVHRADLGRITERLEMLLGH
jgi:hypothetical protein